MGKEERTELDDWIAEIMDMDNFVATLKMGMLSEKTLLEMSIWLGENFNYADENFWNLIEEGLWREAAKDLTDTISSMLTEVHNNAIEKVLELVDKEYHVVREEDVKALRKPTSQEGM